MERSALIKERIESIKSDLEGVNLIAVSKYTDAHDIRMAYDAGHTLFGESRVQDLLTKSDELSELDIEWHFIGRLQSNKINNLLKVSGLTYIHSIDSISLLEALIKRLSNFSGKRLGLFLQYNTSQEEEKGGFLNLEELQQAAQMILAEGESKIFLAGLMTIGRIRTDAFEDEAIKSFSMLKEMRDALDPKLSLSMGMSSDYKLAIAHGSNYVRVGSAIFR